MGKNKNSKKNKKVFEKREKKQNSFILPEETKNWIWGILIFIIAIIFVFSFFDLAGIAGKTLIRFLLFLIGKTTYVTPLVLALAGLVFFSTKYKKFFRPTIVAILIVIFGISGIFEGLGNSLSIKYGGYLGYLMALPFLKFFGFWVSQIVFGGFIMVGFLIFWFLLRQPAQKGVPKIEKRDEKAEEEKKPSLIKKFFAPQFQVKEIEPKVRGGGAVPKTEILPLELKTKEVLSRPLISEYKAPPLDLLDSETGIPNAGDVRMSSAIIKKTLENFNIPVEMAEINIGPTVTQYTFKPAEGIKLSKITGLSNDLSLALAAHPVRMEAPVPGRSVVGIEIPNKVRTQVRLKNLISNSQFQSAASTLTLSLGKDVSGSPIYTDLSRMPHMLVAGATGTGKTIFLNGLITSLLYRNSPDMLRFILVDPKRVEFTVYQDLPHLLCPVILDPQKTINALKWLVMEMERRFDILAADKCRDILGYNEQSLRSERDPMPFIVLIVDELADLMAARGRDMEGGIVRLAQMARAVGIHLILATQRPSVEVITGLIKANVTARVTFQVASQVDSRTVLDMAGAEKLLGRGDMLFLSAEFAKPKRIQSAYISEKEVRRVVGWIKSNVSGATSQRSIEEELIQNQLNADLGKSLDIPSGDSENSYFQDDPMYEEAKRVVIEAKKGSASLLQRRLRIGYARAARLIDMLEEKNVIGPGEGAKPREVFAKIEIDNGNSNEEENNDEDGEGNWKKL